jgi:hypothetical protein
MSNRQLSCANIGCRNKYAPPQIWTISSNHFQVRVKPFVLTYRPDAETFERFIHRAALQFFGNTRDIKFRVSMDKVVVDDAHSTLSFIMRL